jgi:aquaporin Z
MLHAVLAEFVGTFFFVSIILYITTTYPGNIFVPLVVGLALALGIYFSSISSLGSLNPAVTLALFLRKNISGKEAAFYIVAEILGAVLAYIWWRYMTSCKVKNSSL